MSLAIVLSGNSRTAKRTREEKAIAENKSDAASKGKHVVVDKQKAKIETVRAQNMDIR